MRLGSVTLFWRARRDQASMAVAAAACSVALAAFAQWRLDRGLLNFGTLMCYVAGGLTLVAVFGGVAGPVQPERLEAEPRWHAAFHGSMRTVAVLLGLALLGCLDFGGNRFRPLGLVFWLGGLLLCLCYLRLGEGDRTPGWDAVELLRRRSISVPGHWLLPMGAMLVGAVLRLHRLEAIPADMGWDLPYNYFDTLSILQGQHNIFFPANMGREGLFFYLIAAVARLGTLSHYAVKLTSALVGIITIPAMYAAAHKLFSRSVAVVAAFLLAVNRWHIVLSRSGFRVILLPLFVIGMLYTLARAFESRRLSDLALAGLVLGLGLHSYTSFQFALPATVVAFVLCWLHMPRGGWRTAVISLGAVLSVAFAAYAPLGRFAVEYPEQYLQRLALQVRLVGSHSEGSTGSLAMLLGNLRTSLLMFNVAGDANSRFNVPFARHLGFFSGMLFVLGLFYSLRHWQRRSMSLLLPMFIILIVPMTLAMQPHEMPNLFRSAGTIGPVVIMAALPLPVIAERLRQLAMTSSGRSLLLRLRLERGGDGSEHIWAVGRRHLLGVLPVLAGLVLVGLECRETRQFYFWDFVNALPDVQNVSIAREMARQIEAYGDVQSCYIKVWPHWFDGRALRVYLRRQDEAWNPEFTDVVADQPPLSSVTVRGMFIVHPEDYEALTAIRGAFRHSATKAFGLPNGRAAFVAVYVER